MGFTPNTQRREDLVKLRAYVKDQPNGARLSWVEIQTATSVNMHDAKQYGRNLFRSACHREQRGYLPLPGGGVELSSAENAVEIVERNNGRVLGAVKAAAEKNGYVGTRHIGEMSGDAARALIRASSFTATLAMFAKQAAPKEEPAKLPPAATPKDEAAE